MAGLVVTVLFALGSASPFGPRAHLGALAPAPRPVIRVDPATGAVTGGERARVGAFALAHGGLQLRVVPSPSPGLARVQTSPPSPSLAGSGRAVTLPAGCSVQELTSALARVGTPPREVALVLQAMRASGALDAEVVAR